jgi:hypothetical protein
LPALALALALPSSPAHAEARPRALREPIEAAVGTEAGLLVATRAGVKVLDPAGRVISSLDHPAESTPAAGPARSPPPSRGAVGWPGLTGDADHSGAIVDPDDIDDDDDPRFADEGQARPWNIDESERASRGASGVPTPAPQRPLLAAAGEDGWVVRADGLWHLALRSGAAAKVATIAGARIRAIAAAGVSKARGETVAVVGLADGGHLRVSRDGGLTFLSVADDAPELGTFVVDARGVLAGLDHGGRLRTWRLGRGELILHPPLPAPADDLTSCGTEILVLAAGTMYRLAAPDAAPTTGAPPADRGTAILTRVGPAPPGAERLVCGEPGAGWVAWGNGIYVSVDSGRTWRTRPGPATANLQTLIPTRLALWIVVAAGAWPLPSITHDTEAVESGGRAQMPASSHATSLASWSRPRDPWRGWYRWLPIVDVEFEVGRFGAVRDVRGLVSASFRLDGPWAGGRPLRPPRRPPDALRPRGRDTVALDALAAGTGDPIAAEERRALSRILEEPP